VLILPAVCNALKEPCLTERKSKTSFGTKNKNGDIAVSKEYIRHNKMKIKGNVWEYNVGNLSDFWNNSSHPAVFPEALANDHIISWSNEGDTVLDCFSGSGTTLKMAKLLNRHYIGIEMSTEYVTLAENRLAGDPAPLHSEEQG